MRIKVVEFEGARCTIGALTMKQVREFFGETDRKAVTNVEIVIVGLNNALQEQKRRCEVSTDAPEYTRERIEEEFDAQLVLHLRDEIGEFSGLKITDAVTQGETVAASA